MYFNRRQCVDLRFDHCCNGVNVVPIRTVHNMHKYIPIHNIWVVLQQQ